jgi:hypothetical protein
MILKYLSLEHYIFKLPRIYDFNIGPMFHKAFKEEQYSLNLIYFNPFR